LINETEESKHRHKTEHRTQNRQSTNPKLSTT